MEYFRTINELTKRQSISAIFVNTFRKLNLNLLIAGAVLLQVYTGWIYNGPLMVRRILQGIGSLLEQNGLNSISEAVGLEAKPKK